MNLQVQQRRTSKSAHARTVTRFCDEANITENDQLDLAEFILAAHYLGTGASDEQLMDVFFTVESSNDSNKKNPKELIRELMGKVNEQFGKGSSNHENLNEIKEEEDYEVVTLSTHGKEDAKWQEIHLDSFLNSTANDQTLKIAKNLLKTTALTRAEIAQLTGIDPNLLEGDEEESDEEDDEGEDEKENEKKQRKRKRKNKSSCKYKTRIK